MKGIKGLCPVYPRCPICGQRVHIIGQTKDKRLIGSCKDAFTIKQWLAKDD